MMETRTASAKRYGKKGRTSSPAPSAVTAIDYDELPGLTLLDNSKKPSLVLQRRPGKATARKANTVSTSIGKTRASAMRRKDEKLDKPAPIKIKAEKKVPETRAQRVSNADSLKITAIKAVDAPENKRLTRSKLKSDSKKVGLLYVSSLY
jgi:hypothetical protein